MHRSIQKFSRVLFVALIFVASCSPDNPGLDQPSPSAVDRNLAYSAAELDLLLPELLADARIAGLNYCLIRENELNPENGHARMVLTEAGQIVD